LALAKTESKTGKAETGNISRKNVGTKNWSISRFKIGAGVVVAFVIGLMAYDTTLVRIGSQSDIRQQAFSPQAFAEAEFPKLRAFIEQHAAPATEIVAALAQDKQAAARQYGVGDVNPVIAVAFGGVVEERRSNYHRIKVEGLVEDIVIRVQTGPAINGTDLRDATGTIGFAQFKNQIEYQDAGSALNNEVKNQVLQHLDRDTLLGKTVSVVGVFRLVNAKNWLVTPIKVDVQ